MSRAAQRLLGPSSAHLTCLSAEVGLSDGLLLASALSRNTHLTCLDLAGSSFGLEALEMLMDACCTRQRLRPVLARPADEVYADDDDQGALASGLGGRSVGGSVSASSRGGGQGAKVSGSAGKRNSLLGVLALAAEREQRIVPHASGTGGSGADSGALSPLSGGASVGTFVGACGDPLPPPRRLSGRLRSLSLAGVTLGSGGATVVAKALFELCSLEHLSLARCDLGDKGSRSEGAEELADALLDEAPPSAPAVHPRCNPLPVLLATTRTILFFFFSCCKPFKQTK